MEPQFSVLLYSKYSPLSKKILDIIQSSPVNLEQIVSLQTLCIDNEKVRKKIYQNKQIDITSVPCILVIFPDGGIEKYDGVPAFQWIEEILQKFAPPPPQPQQPPPPPQKSLQQIQIEEKRKQKIIKQNKKKLVESQRDQERMIQKQKYERYLNNSNSEEIKNSHTNIDDLDSEDEDEDEDNNINEKQNDRYRHRKPIGSIREDSGNYSRDDDLFAGDQPDTRQAKKSAVKQPIDASQKKTLDLMAKAKEMEKRRQESPLPPGRPART
tara:strand:- start:5461 stop:6264 length:804 start_codon:yes stop_codon:yes gene_type:complete